MAKHRLINTNNGTLISQSPGWTDVVTLTFSVIKTSGTSNLVWQTANNNWGIFDANNSTMWSSGNWLNENTSPLPVELTKFNAANSGSTVELKWQTATELNNYGFEIQRASKSASTSSASTSSATGSTMNWEKIGFISGKGTSSHTNNYDFTDKNPLTGKSLYRLKQIDQSGDYEYSQIVEITSMPLEFSLSQNYPNPFNPSTTISYTIAKKSFVKIIVYDITGSEISNLVNSEKDAGTYKINFNALNLASGMYIYQIQADNYTATKKMVLLK